MKLRVRGDSLRLRVTQSEVARLIDGAAVTECTQIGPAQLRYSLQADAADNTPMNRPQIRFETGAEGGEIKVVVAGEQLRAWGESAEVGIEATVDSLALLIEKDFACLDPRDGAEDSDTFPNPKAT